jgi:hypothetical protein
MDSYKSMLHSSRITNRKHSEDIRNMPRRYRDEQSSFASSPERMFSHSKKKHLKTDK